MTRLPLVTSNPEVLGGTPVVTGTRIPVAVVAGRLDQGEPVATLLDDYPALGGVDLEALRAYARANPEPAPVHPWRGP